MPLFTCYSLNKQCMFRKQYFSSFPVISIVTSRKIPFKDFWTDPTYTCIESRGLKFWLRNFKILTLGETKPLINEKVGRIKQICTLHTCTMQIADLYDATLTSLTERGCIALQLRWTISVYGNHFIDVAIVRNFVSGFERVHVVSVDKFNVSMKAGGLWPLFSLLIEYSLERAFLNIVWYHCTLLKLVICIRQVYIHVVQRFFINVSNFFWILLNPSVHGV